MGSIAGRGGAAAGSNGLSRSTSLDSTNGHWRSRRPWVWSAIAIAVAVLLMVSGWLRPKSDEVAINTPTPPQHVAVDKELPPATVSSGFKGVTTQFAEQDRAVNGTVKRLDDRDRKTLREETDQLQAPSNLADAKSPQADGHQAPGQQAREQWRSSTGPSVPADGAIVQDKQDKAADRQPDRDARQLAKDQPNVDSDVNVVAPGPSQAPAKGFGSKADSIAGKLDLHDASAAGKGGAIDPRSNAVVGSPLPAVPPGISGASSRGGPGSNGPEATGRSLGEMAGRHAAPNLATDGLIVAQCVTTSEVAARSFQTLLSRRGIALYDAPAERRSAAIPADDAEMPGEKIEKQAASPAAVKTEVVYVEGTPEQILGLVRDLRSQPTTYRALAVSAATSPEMTNSTLGLASDESLARKSLLRRQKQDGATASAYDKSDGLGQPAAPAPNASARKADDKVVGQDTKLAGQPEAGRGGSSALADEVKKPGQPATTATAPIPSGSTPSAAPSSANRPAAPQRATTQGIKAPAGPSSAGENSPGDELNESIAKPPAPVSLSDTTTSDNEYRHVPGPGTAGSQLPAKIRAADQPVAGIGKKNAVDPGFAPDVVAGRDSKGAALQGRGVDETEKEAKQPIAEIDAAVDGIHGSDTVRFNFEKTRQAASPATGWAMRMVDLPPVLKSKLSSADASANNRNGVAAELEGQGAVRGTEAGQSVDRIHDGGRTTTHLEVAKRAEGTIQKNLHNDQDEAGADKPNARAAEQAAADGPGSGKSGPRDNPSGPGGGRGALSGGKGEVRLSQPAELKRQESAVSQTNQKDGAIAVRPLMQAVFVFQISAAPNAAVPAAIVPAAAAASPAPSTVAAPPAAISPSAAPLAPAAKPATPAQDSPGK
jgi:hypothetical protein